MKERIERLSKEGSEESLLRGTSRHPFSSDRPRWASGVEHRDVARLDDVSEHGHHVVATLESHSRWGCRA